MGAADYRMMTEATGQRIAAALEAMSLDNTIADAYSSSATYAVGDYCIYNNTLYKCNTAISTAEAWTPAHWTATTVSEEFISKTDIVDNLTRQDTDKPAAQKEVYDLNNKFTTDFPRSRMISLNWRSYSSLKDALEAQTTVYSAYDIVIANAVLNGGGVYFGFIWRKDSSNLYAVFFGSTGAQTTLNSANGGSTWTAI